MELTILHTISSEYVQSIIDHYDRYEDRKVGLWAKDKFMAFLAQEYTRAVFDNDQVLYFQNEFYSNVLQDLPHNDNFTLWEDFDPSNGRIDRLPVIQERPEPKWLDPIKEG